jgi:AraC family transcriptional regulator of adaptative response / DNA-3-methyladenine glycosylase II
VTFDDETCYRALSARDARFDGLFFVAVTTTGVYCRPVCSARTPRRERCVFYRSGAEAERDGFRACLRCRPELAPGRAASSAPSSTVARAAQHIEAGALNDAGLDELALRLGVTARHLRRAMRAELGISPIELAQSCRMALAKRLLHDSALSMTNIAFAGGFGSVRRFNASFRARYGRPPSALRKAQRKGPAAGDTIALTLDYRAPYDWPCMLEYLRTHATAGLELVRDGAYLRTVRFGEHRGFVRVAPLPGRHALCAQVSHSLAPALMPLVKQLRRVFDLDAQPEVIGAHLERDTSLSRSARAHAGLRVPGAFDGFETAVRTVIGQQVSVAAATTVAGRWAMAFGDAIETPYPELCRLTPPPERVAAASERELCALGMMPARARTLRALATAVASRSLVLEAPAPAERVMRELIALPGIGPWTAQYVAMRALSWPDAFLEGDLGIRKALGGVSARAALARAEEWRPWRAYAAMHLWASLSSARGSDHA